MIRWDEDTDIITMEELKEGFQRMLKGLGMTLEELRDEARESRFRSEYARLVWMACGRMVQSGELP